MNNKGQPNRVVVVVVVVIVTVIVVFNNFLETLFIN